MSKDDKFIRNIDPDLFRRMQHAALRRHVAVGVTVNEALAAWLDAHEAKAPPAKTAARAPAPPGPRPKSPPRPPPAPRPEPPPPASDPPPAPVSPAGDPRPAADVLPPVADDDDLALRIQRRLRADPAWQGTPGHRALLARLRAIRQAARRPPGPPPEG